MSFGVLIEYSTAPKLRMKGQEIDSYPSFELFFACSRFFLSNVSIFAGFALYHLRVLP